MRQEIGKIKISFSEPVIHMWSVAVEPGKRPLRRHGHINFEIMLVDSGSGLYTTERCRYPIKPGDLFVFMSGERHCITDVGEEGLCIVNLHFDPIQLLGSLSEELSDENANFCFSHSKSFENRIPAESTGELPALFRQIRREFEQCRPEYALSVFSLLKLIIVELIRNYNYAEQGPQVKRRHIHSVRKAVSFIDAHLAEPLSLSLLSQAAGISPNYLSSVFHQVSGTTLWDYVNSRRIDRALRRLISDPEENILSIALSCGFNSTASFNKAFKKVTGMTPTEFRESGDILTI